MNFHQSPTTYIGNVHLKVADIERSIEFYEQIIGFKLLRKDVNKADLTADGTTALLTIEQLSGFQHKFTNTAGLYHLALLLPERKYLANITRHFADLNVRFGAGDHLVSEALYLSDPDGNGIEIYVDRDPRKWIWNDAEVAMTTDQVDFADLLTEESAGGWQGLPANTVMGHVHLQVGNLDENQAFYVDGLGFDIVNRYGPQALFISDNNYHHHIAFNTWAGVGIPNPDEKSLGLASFSLVLANESERDQLINRLTAKEIEVQQEQDIYYVIDPSGTLIKLII